MLIYFLLILQKPFVLLGSLPGNAGQIMKVSIEGSGTSLPQRNDQFPKVHSKNSTVKIILALAVLICLLVLSKRFIYIMIRSCQKL